ncbi:MAG: hypothetical protein Q4C42_08030 [Clostridia bacterium]|nr:hypothetical protein [Clostridia bacterium]
MTAVDIILIAVIAAAIVGAVALNRYRKKTSSCCGGASGCSGNCSCCSGCKK